MVRVHLSMLLLAGLAAGALTGQECRAVVDVQTSSGDESKSIKRSRLPH